MIPGKSGPENVTAAEGQLIGLALKYFDGQMKSVGALHPADDPPEKIPVKTTTDFRALPDNPLNHSWLSPSKEY
jgi:hypothetical protein